MTADAPSDERIPQDRWVDIRQALGTVEFTRLEERFERALAAVGATLDVMIEVAPLDERSERHGSRVIVPIHRDATTLGPLAVILRPRDDHSAVADFFGPAPKATEERDAWLAASQAIRRHHRQFSRRLEWMRELDWRGQICARQAALARAAARRMTAKDVLHQVCRAVRDTARLATRPGQLGLPNVRFSDQAGDVAWVLLLQAAPTGHDGAMAHVQGSTSIPGDALRTLAPGIQEPTSLSESSERSPAPLAWIYFRSPVSQTVVKEAIVHLHDGRNSRVLQRRPAKLTEQRWLSEILGPLAHDASLNFVVLPIEGRDKWLGACVVGLQGMMLTPSEIYDVSTLVSFAAPAMLREAEFGSALALLDKTSNALDQGVEPAYNALLAQIAQRARDHLAADLVVIAVADRRSGQIDLARTIINSSQRFISGEPISEPGHRINDIEEHEWHAARAAPDVIAGIKLSGHNLHSAFTVPIVETRTYGESVSREQAIGSITYGFCRSRGKPMPEQGGRDSYSFQTAEPRWFRYYATTASRVLREADSLALSEKLDGVVSQLHETASIRLQSNAEEQGDLDSIIDELERVAFAGTLAVTYADSGALVRPASERETLRIALSHGLRSPALGAEIPLSSGTTGVAATERKSYLLFDSEDASSLPGQRTPIVSDPPAKSELAVPIASSTDGGFGLHGVLTMQSTVSTGAFSTTDVQHVERIASTLALCLDLARSFAQSRSLNSALQEMESATGVDSILQIAANELARVTASLSVSARRIDATGQMLRPTVRVGKIGALEAMPIRLFEGVGGWVAGHKRECYLRDVRDPDELARFPGLEYLRARTDTRCEFSLPLRFRGDFIGVLNIEHPHVDGLGPHMAYIRAMASQVSYASYFRRREKIAQTTSPYEQMEGLLRTYYAVSHDFAHKLEDLAQEADTLAGISEGNRSTMGARILREADRVRFEIRSLPVLEPTREVVEMRSLIGRTIEIARAKYGDRVEFEYDSGPDADGLCSPGMVEWILATIFSNSVHAAEQLPAVISCSVTADTGAGVTKVRIEDNGKSLPVEQWQEVFEQVRTSLIPTGTGRALPIARLMARVMSGDLEVVQAHGQGFAIELTIPDGTGDDWR